MTQNVPPSLWTPDGPAESCFFHPLLITQNPEGVHANIRHFTSLLMTWRCLNSQSSQSSQSQSLDLLLTVRMQPDLLLQLNTRAVQYSHRAEVLSPSPSPFNVPPWSPRRYFPLRPRMASRPCSCSSREKSSGTSPSEHTSPALFTYQKRPVTPATGQAQGVSVSRRCCQQETKAPDEIKHVVRRPLMW